MKKIVSLLLVAALLLGCFTVTAFAMTDDEMDRYYYGKYEPGVVQVSLKDGAPSIESLLSDFEIESVEHRVYSFADYYVVSFTEKTKGIVIRALEVLWQSPCVESADANWVHYTALLVPGYYVVGTMNGWAIDKAYLMQPSNSDGRYVLNQTALKAGNELKIVYSANGIKASKWYPEGVDNNYVVTESSLYYNIELAPDYDGEGEDWYSGCIKAQICPPPIGAPDPTEPEPVNRTRELWERGAELTAGDIEEAANEQYQSREYFYADKITIHNSYRFNCTPAYIVDFNVEGYGVYLTVITEEKLGDYLFYSTSSYEPSIFVDDKLYTLTKAYKAGVLTDEMLAELAATDYMGGDPWNRCRIITRYIKGDADGDGEVNVIDATYVQRYDVNIIGENGLYKPLADVDGDSEVSVIDATLIQRYDVGLYCLPES